MRAVTASMATVVKGMDVAMKTMNLERISQVMDRFESQFEDLDVAAGYYETATSSATAVATPQEEVDRLMGQIADESGLERAQELTATAAPERGRVGPTEQEEDVYVLYLSPTLCFFGFMGLGLIGPVRLGERLRALRG
jgi:charged multivesicular body protein 1